MAAHCLRGGTPGATEARYAFERVAAGPAAGISLRHVLDHQRGRLIRVVAPHLDHPQRTTAQRDRVARPQVPSG